MYRATKSLNINEIMNPIFEAIYQWDLANPTTPQPRQWWKLDRTQDSSTNDEFYYLTKFDGAHWWALIYH
jgi:hypothetical protein